MKLHYIKILLFVILLNILLTSYHEHNNNEPYIIPHHTPIYTSRVLSEKDIHSSIYNKGADMKSVKESFDDRTSQRFEEYEERMKDKLQKRKEQRDKNIQKIIEKDKMEKSLEEKIEKGCLKCGCALGGGVLPVWGLVSGLWYGTWLQYLSGKALPAGIKKGIEVGLSRINVITGTYTNIKKFPEITVTEMLSSGKFTNGVDLFDMFEYISSNMYNRFMNTEYYNYWNAVDSMVEGGIDLFNTNNSAHITAVTEAVEKGKADAIALEHAKYTHLYNAIGYSFLAILIIVLVMIIIYLVLRYRKKKKMKKKAEYTKLLNQ
ncbi:rifin PIR protein,putative [Plasmodium sp. DRC-Itaito]|nr:rifin PIR protein,putative [Plasmodium sp. DRC-Itaito]